MDEETRRALVRNLEQILAGSPEQRRAFVNAVDEEIDIYYKLSRPGMLRSRADRRQLEHLSKAGRAFLTAFEAMDRAAYNKLRQTMIVQKRPNAPTNNSDSDIAGVDATITLLPKAVLDISDAADVSINSFRIIDEETILFAFTDRLAEFYGVIFGERPRAEPGLSESGFPNRL